MRVLVLSADSSLVNILADVSKEFAIETQHRDNHKLASDQLNRAKYAGLILDLDTVPDARLFIANMNENPSTQTAVVFPVATKIDPIDTLYGSCYTSEPTTRTRNQESLQAS